MASSDKPDPESKPVAEAPPPPAACRSDCFAVDVALRVLLFAATVTALVVMVTSKQTKLVPAPLMPTVMVPAPAKFNHSPAFIYFVVAMCVACLYSIITILASLSVFSKPGYAKTFLFHLAIWDMLMLGLVASATGTAGGVAYIGLKGNSHVRWGKVCGLYDTFCRHVGSSIAISLFASVLLVFLCTLSILSLYRKIRD